jgi:hypothetical protein
MNASLTAEQLFGFAGQAASIGWLILVFLPRRINFLFFIPQYFIPFGLSLLYAGLALTYLNSGEGGFGSIGDVRKLFQNDFALLAGWIHYLAFDLFVGAWIARSSDEIGLSRLIQAPILIATFMFGPVGLVLFLSIRAALTKVEVAR